MSETIESPTDWSKYLESTRNRKPTPTKDPWPDEADEPTSDREIPPREYTFELKDLPHRDEVRVFLYIDGSPNPLNITELPRGLPSGEAVGKLRAFCEELVPEERVEAAALQVEFGIVPKDVSTDLLSADELLKHEPTGWLIRGVVPENGMASIFARDQQGKTFQALDWALHLALGIDWAGFPTQQAPVVYVAAEGEGKLGLRVKAWQSHHERRATPHLFFYTRPVHLVGNDERSETTKELVEYVRQTEARFVVIDTLNRCLNGRSENDPSTMATALESLDEVRAVNGTTVLVLHHTDKNNRDARGHSLLFDAMDTKFRTSLKKNHLTLTCQKQRDGRAGWQRGFTLHEVDLGYELLDGTPARSCVLTGRSPEKVDEVPNDERVVRALERLDGEATVADLSRESGIPRTTAKRVGERLVEDGVLEAAGRGFRLAE